MDSAVMLATIRPGPVLTVYRDGVEVARVPLTIGAALGLVADLVAAIRGGGPDGHDPRRDDRS